MFKRIVLEIIFFPSLPIPFLSLVRYNLFSFPSHYHHCGSDKLSEMSLRSKNPFSMLAPMATMKIASTDFILGSLWV
jgi:hypothetical protein